MEPSVFIVIMNDLWLLSLLFSSLMRVRLCIKTRSKKVVVGNDARLLFSSDFIFLYTASFKLIFDTALLDILLMVLFCIFVSKMEELYIYIKQLRNQLPSLERRAKNLKELCGELALDNDRLLEENPILRNQLQSLERKAKNLKELSEELALDKDRLLQENNQLGSEVGTMTEQVNAAETNATMVKKVTLILTMIVLDYDRLLKENKNLKNQLDWEMVTSADTD